MKHISVKLSLHSIIVFLFLLSLPKNLVAQNITKDTTELTSKSIDMGEVIIKSKKIPLSTIVGANNQPLWSTMRMFPSTRIYVMDPPGTAMYERWFDIRERRKGPAQVRMRDEFSFGLAKHLQLDLYNHTVYDLNKESGNIEFGWRGFSWELRYAFADWGKIWGNPTLYFEHKLLDKYQGIEPKLLLGDKIGKKGIWGLNIIYEANLAKTKLEQEREFASTGSIARIVNTSWTIGGSFMHRHNFYPNDDENKSEFDEFYIGADIQYRFNNKSYVSVEYMPGLTNDSKKSRSFIIFGYRF